MVLADNHRLLPPPVLWRVDGVGKNGPTLRAAQCLEQLRGPRWCSV